MELQEIKSALDKITDQVKEQGEKALAEAKSAGSLAQKTKELVDDLLLQKNELTERVKAVEQAATETFVGQPAQKSGGEQVVDSDAFRQFKERGFQGSMKVEVKAVTSTAAGALIRPLYETEPVALLRRRFTIRNLLPVVPIATSSVDYPKQTTRTNAAAPVAESAAKPYSDYAWSNATAPVRTIAHLAKLTRQAMDDAPRLIAEVESEMRYGLALVEEAQILNGDGTGQNLNGIVTQATAYAAPFTLAGATSIDLIRLGMLQAELALYPSDGIVLNPSDWTRMQLSKDTTNQYLFSDPQGVVGPRLWGLPVVSTPAMTIDKFLVGSFRFGATLYDRMGVEVLISTENVDDFEKNLATMRCEERLALAVKRPGAFIFGDFGLVA